MQLAMVMVMAMTMSNKRPPPSMLPSQDDAHTMIGDFTRINVSNSNDNLHLVQPTSARVMVACRTIRQWRHGGRCHFGCSFCHFSSLLFTSLLLWMTALYKRRPHGLSSPPGTLQVEVECPSPLDLPNGYHTVWISGGAHGFIQLRTFNGWLIVFRSTLLRIYAAQVVWTSRWG